MSQQGGGGGGKEEEESVFTPPHVRDRKHPVEEEYGEMGVAGGDDEPHTPMAPPPAAAPPPPPPTPPLDWDGDGAGDGEGGGGETEGKKSKKGGWFGRGKKKGKGGSEQPKVVRSYQRGESLGEAARPTIEHYDDGVDGANGGGGPNGGGGVNRGMPNSAEGGGTTLPELIFRMRILNMILCALALGFEVPSWIFKAWTNPARAVLGVYLAFFAGLLCCFELHVPSVARFIRSNFGLLYSPGGRAAFLFLMGGLCLGQGNMFEFVLGFVMVANGFYTLYLPWRYPAYERAHEELGRENIVTIAAKRASGYAWAKPELVSRYVGGTDEGERLLG